MKLFSLFKKARSQESGARSQSGRTDIFIVIVVILIAILLAGGELFLGDFLPLPDSLSSSLGGGSGTPGDRGTDPAADWSIEIENKGCEAQENTSVATVTGLAPGYISVEISNGAGGFAVIQTDSFTNLPVSVYELSLPNTLGFNTTPWRVRVFEGGTQNGNDFSGGTEKAVKDASSTGC